MEWIKINPNHRPAIGHVLYSTFNPADGGTLYIVSKINETGFNVQSYKDKDGKDIPEDHRVTLFVPYDLIPITNFYVWDRHRENNYEIDETYSN